MTAGNVLVFPHTMSDGAIRTDDDIAVNVPSTFLVTIAMLEMLDAQFPGNGDADGHGTVQVVGRYRHTPSASITETRYWLPVKVYR